MQIDCFPRFTVGHQGQSREGGLGDFGRRDQGLSASQEDIVEHVAPVHPKYVMVVYEVSAQGFLFQRSPMTLA